MPSNHQSISLTEPITRGDAPGAVSTGGRGPIIHTIASLDSIKGGPSRNVPALCDYLSHCDWSVRLLSQDLGGENLTPSSSSVEMTVVKSVGGPLRRIAYSPEFAPKLRAMCQHKRPLLLHDHGVWLPSNLSSAQVAKSLCIPLVVSPRGMLEPWSLGYRKIKKAICWRLYQQRTLAGATAFSVTSEQEAESVRRLGFRQPVAVIANGVQIPPLRQSIHLERPTALFMSRLHRKKGIYELLAAWKRLTPPDWQLLIAGTDEDGEEKQIRAHIRTLGLEQCCTLIGPLAGKRKEALLASVNLFLLPSHSENFGQAVVESLAHGVPVLTTTGTPWSSLVSHRCGWWVELDADSLDRGIREATSLPLATLAEMGERGRRFVGETFTWSQIADQTSCFYDWLLHGGERPGYIL